MRAEESGKEGILGSVGVLFGVVDHYHTSRSVINWFISFGPVDGQTFVAGENSEAQSFGKRQERPM